MTAYLFGINPFILVIAMLFVVIICISGGKGLGFLAQAVAKRYLGRGGKEVVNVVNVETATLSPPQVQALSCLINPENCPKHGEETQRSLQNKADIAKLEATINNDRSVFWKELKAIRRGISIINMGLVKRQILEPQEIPMED